MNFVKLHVSILYDNYAQLIAILLKAVLSEGLAS